MDSFLDLSDALNDGGKPNTVNQVCANCRSLAAPGTKLRYCGRCNTAMYCSSKCGKAHWAVHKKLCETARKTHERAASMHAEKGGRKKDLQQAYRGIAQFFSSVPGFACEVGLMAWKHRNKSPLIHAWTYESDVDGSGIQVEMIPRTAWDKEPRLQDINYSWISGDHRETLRHAFDATTSFRPDEHFMIALKIIGKDNVHRASVGMDSFAVKHARGVEIVDALTAATRPKDLADAFAWFESVFPAHDAQEQLKCIRSRSERLYGGGFTPPGSVPVPTRELNNEVAYMMTDSLLIAFNVQLLGLKGAAHLNGKEGVICGPDPANPARWTTRLDDGKLVNVKATNFVHVRRGEYTRKSP